MRVLIVEDEPLIRFYISASLKKKKAPHDTAQNGREALDLYKKNDYTLILTDIRMPEMTGLDFLKEIKKLDKEIPNIVVISAFLNDEETQQYDDMVTAFLNKPINWPMISEIIDEYS